jgi:hypothetical protein
MKSRRLWRLKFTTSVRRGPLTPSACRAWPVTRIRNVPVAVSIIVASGVAVRQRAVPLAGSSSIV